MILVSAGWALAGLLGAVLLWPPYKEMVLVGGVIGVATGAAFLRARIIDDWKLVIVFAAVWAGSMDLPAIIAGPMPGIVADVVGVALSGAASGLVLRIAGRDVPWRSLAVASGICALAPLAAFIALIPILIVAVLIGKSLPLALMYVLFTLGGAIAGALAGRVMLTQFGRGVRERAEGPTEPSGVGGAASGVGIVYEAFISYRQSPRDAQWAKWLHDQLESWRTPAGLARSARIRRRLLPVFLDQAELIASPDLTAEIRGALEAARFLVVICSPRTPHSKWISEEVEYFIKLGRRNQILFLLIEGELRKAVPFPYVARGTPPEDAAAALREPLAADVRPVGARTPREKQRLAVLKLLAPILGVRLDDLRRRAEQRRRHNGILTAFAACAAIAAGGLIVSAKLGSDRLVRAKGLAQKAAEVFDRQPVRGLLMAAFALRENLAARKEVDPAILHTLFAAMSRNSGTPLLGHGAAVRTIAFSRDETWLVSGDFEGRLGFWKLTDSAPSAIWMETERPRILALDISVDGRTVVAGADSLVTMCDVTVPERIECAPLARPEGQVWSVTFSPDGKWLAAGGVDRRVRLWRSAANGTFQPAGELPVKLPVVRLAWSPLGDWLAASTSYTSLPKERQDSNSLVLWRISSQGPGDRIETPKTPGALALQFSPDGTWLAAGDEEGGLRFWRVSALGTSPQPEAVLNAGSSVLSLAFDKSGKWLVTGGDDVRIWKLDKGPMRAEATLVNEQVAGLMGIVYAVAVSAEGLVAVGSSFPVSWEGQYLYSPRQISRIGGHEQPVTSVVFSSTGHLLASADFGGVVRVHDVHAGFDGSTAWASDAGAVMSPDGNWVATMEQPPRLLSKADGFHHPYTLPDFHSRLSKLQFSPDSKLLVVLGSDGASSCWFIGPSGLGSSQHLASIGKQRYSESSALIAFSNSGDLFATAGDEGTGHVWKRADHQIIQIGEVSHLQVRMFDRPSLGPVRPLADQIHSMSFSPDGKWLATGSANGSLIVWDVASGAPGNAILRMADGDRLHPEGVWRIEFLNLMNGQVIVTGGADGRVIVRSWIAERAKVLIEHQAFRGFLMSLASDAGEHWIATGGGLIPQPWGSPTLEYDSRVLLWRTGLLLSQPTILLGLQGSVGALAFHPKSALLAGAGEKEIRFWKLDGDTPETLPFILSSPEATALRFSDDGEYLFASGFAGARLWSFDPSDLLAEAERLAGRNLTREEWSEEFGGLPYTWVFPHLP